MYEGVTQTQIQVGITLASIAYLGEDSNRPGEFTSMAKALQQKDLPTNADWSMVWGPVNIDSNLMYIAQGPKTQLGREYAVVIRGAIKTFTSVLKDLELDLVDLPWKSISAPTNTQVSYGIRKGIDRLLKVKDSSGKTAMDFLKTLSFGNEILVCGHSLGGCLSTVMALYLKDTLPMQCIKSTPFAGQTAGNDQFASWYVSQFGDTARWANHLDIIPRLWNRSSLESMKSLYRGGPPCDVLFKGLVDVALLNAGFSFCQPGSGTILDGKVYDESGLDPFENEASAQHDHLYYMFLTGIPLSIIQGTPVNPGLGSGWWPPKNQPVTERLDNCTVNAC